MKRLVRAKAAFWMIGVSGLLAAPGCGTSCDRKGELGDEIEFRGGTTHGDVLYETGSWEDPFLAFPPGRTYRLMHDLAEAPPLVVSYLAFRELPYDNADRNDPAGFASPSAGNETIVELVTDEFIQVRNDTCADFFVRVVGYSAGAAGGDGEMAGDDGDAGTSTPEVPDAGG